MRSIICRAAVAALSFLVCLSTAIAEETRQFLVAPFLCTAGSPMPSFTATDERYLHEYKDFSETQHEVCALVEQFQILRQGRAPLKRECQTFNLVRYTVMCLGGAVSAAQWYAASGEAQRNGFRIQGDTLYAPFAGGGGWQIGGPGITGLQPGHSTSYAALPAGYGLSLRLPVQSLTLDWRRPDIPVTGNVAAVPTPTPAPLWVQRLTDWYPWPQLVIGIPLLLYGFVALIGQRTDNPPASGTACLLALVAALACLPLTRAPAALPDEARKHAEVELARVRGQMTAIEQDRATLTGIINLSPQTGMVEPISAYNLGRIVKLTQPRSVAAPQTPETNPASWALLLLAPAGAFLLFYVLAFLRGAHYLFVAHPAAIVAAPALRSGSPFDAQELGAALRPRPEDVYDLPPAYQSWNLFKRARTLRQKIEVDADIAEAAMRRDRARVQQMQAEAELRAARKKLPWWQRWIWW